MGTIRGDSSARAGSGSIRGENSVHAGKRDQYEKSKQSESGGFEAAAYDTVFSALTRKKLTS